jgi:hypothetical protein
VTASLLAALLSAGVMTAVAADKDKAPDKDDEDDEKA